jgi:ion channel POLLUX/CASTOR
MQQKYSNLLKYHFENALSKSSNFIFFLLAISSISAFIMVFLESSFGLADGFNFNNWWQSLTSIIKLGKGDSGGERFITFIYWVLNVAISGTIIAFLTAKVVTLFQKLNSGKSEIIDTKHYLIIGWNNNIFQICNEIAEANLNQSKPTVVCFSGLANTDMQSRLSTSKVKTRRIRIITRSGNLYNEDELLRLNIRNAKSVIVLNDESVVDFNIESTLLVTRKILSDIKVPVIAQFNSSENIDVFSKSDQNLLPVNNNSVMASITTQAIRNKEISEVILDFLDYDGDEIYFFPPKNLVGKTFDECKMQVMNISIFGIFNSNNTISLNPKGNTLIKSDDKLVAIAEDDDLEIDFKTDTIVQKSQSTKIDDKKEVKSILFIGWSSIGQLVLEGIQQFIDHKSFLGIYHQANSSIESPNFAQDFKNVTYNDVKSTSSLIDIDYINKTKVDTIIILQSEDEGLNQEKKDALNLILDLNLNELKKTGAINNDIRVILHLNDGAKKSLTQNDSSHEFIMSDLLTSLLITQLTDNPYLAGIFDELFNERGAKIQIHPISKFISGFDSDYEVWQLIPFINNNNHSFLGLTIDDELFLNPNKRMTINPSSQISIITIG